MSLYTKLARKPKQFLTLTGMELSDFCRFAAGAGTALTAAGTAAQVAGCAYEATPSAATRSRGLLCQ